MNLKVISINVGRALLVSALFMFISMLVAVFNDMDSSFAPLAISGIITFVFGSFPFIFVRQSAAISLKDGFMIIVLSWLLSFIFGMLPYVLWGGEFTIVNAWFESVSGYTTTGSTILNDIEILPKGLLFWRTSTHFIGGLGVIVFLLLVLPSASPFRLKLTNMEVSFLSREGYRYRSLKIVNIILSVYVGMMLLATAAFFLAGMPLFDAVNHAFSVVATGGFSTRNLSIAHYDSVAVDLVAIVFMTLSSLHFGLIFAAAVSRSLKPFYKNPTVKYYLTFLLVASVVLMFSLKIGAGYQSWGRAALDAAFSVCSYSSTTGFGVADNSHWPFVACIILMFCAFQCGCSGSTSGGIKADRLYIVFKSILRKIKSSVHPTAVSKIKVGNHYLTDNEAFPILLYILLYCFIIVIGIFLLAMLGVEVPEALSGAVASMGNVGPALGELGALDTYASQPEAAKVVYSFLMILGRLEIYPLFVAIALLFKREN